MPTFRTVGLTLGTAILLCSAGHNLAYAKPFMIVGLDAVSYTHLTLPTKRIV